MREITLPGGNTIQVRGLKRKEMREFKKYGYHISRYRPPEDLDLADEGMEKVLERMLKAEDLALLDELENRHTSAVWFAIIKETYGAPDEEKNSLASGSGEQTKSE